MNKEIKRTKSAFVNSMAGFAAQFIIALLSFVNRSIFVGALGGEYLSVGGLFTNVLTMLSLSEMGIGTAVLFHLYKAVAKRDQDKINALMSFFARVYRVLAAIIAGLGLVCLPILPWLIGESTLPLGYLRGVFLLYVGESVANYLLSYRAQVLFVYQQDYVNRAIVSAATIASTAVQILALKLLPGLVGQASAYLMYLAVYMLSAVARNALCYVVSKKRFPEVRVGRQYRLDADTRRDILRRVRAMFIHKASATVTNATDNIIITKCVSLLSVGLYSNYATVLNMANQIFNQFINGIQASMGSLLAEKDAEKTYEVFRRLYFCCFWLYCVTGSCMAVLFNPFILLWIKDPAYQLGIPVVLVLCANFYIIGVRQAVILTRNAGGLFVHDWFAPVIKMVVNLVVSIVLALRMGLIGVFIGTLISSLLTDVLIMPISLYSHLFNRSAWRYFRRYLLYALVASASAGAGFWLRANVPLLAAPGLWSFLLLGAACFVISNALIVLIFCRTAEFRYFAGLAAGVAKKILRKVRRGSHAAA